MYLVFTMQLSKFKIKVKEQKDYFTSTQGKLENSNVFNRYAEYDRQNTQLASNKMALY